MPLGMKISLNRVPNRIQKSLAQKVWALVSMGATGAAGPVKFALRVHAPISIPTSYRARPISQIYFAIS